MKAPDKIYMPNELLSEEWTRHVEGQDTAYIHIDNLFREFQNEVRRRMEKLNPEDSPMSPEETEAYIEGYRSATSQAVDALADLITKEG